MVERSDKKIVFATTEREAEEARDWSHQQQQQQHQRPSYMPTRGIAAVLNQGLHSLGEKLSKKHPICCLMNALIKCIQYF